MRGMNKLLAPFKRGLQQMLRIGTLLKVNDASPIQMVQVETLSGEVIEVPRIQEFGFSSVPKKGAKGVMAAFGGNTNGYACIKMDDKTYRPIGLKSGETIIYDAFGQFVYFKDNGHIHVIANAQVTATVPVFRIEGNLQVTGEIIDRVDTGGQSMAGMRYTYNGHNHNGDSGGTTSDPNQEMSS